MAELEVYAENTRSIMNYLTLHLLGIDDKTANLAASHLGRSSGICDVIKKSPYFLAQNRSYLPNEILLKYDLYFDKIWDKQKEGHVRDEFYDVILEVASYAKKHLEIAQSYKEQVPKVATRALLHGVETEFYLSELERLNFDPFDSEFRKPSLIKLPYKIYKAAKNNTY